ncbi:MAG: hypothetical protein AB7O56_00385 [Bauldia sp.]
MSFDLLLRLGIALAIGMIVGLERGWRLREEPATCVRRPLGAGTTASVAAGALAAALTAP